MQVWAGCLVGCAVGAGAWLGSRCLALPAGLRGGAERPAEKPGWPRSTPQAPPRLAALLPAGMALLGGCVAWRQGDLTSTTLTLLYSGLLLTLSLVDFQVRRIPNALLLALLGWGLAQALWPGLPYDRGAAAAGIGLVVGGGLFLVLALVRRGALGSGDVKLAAVLGVVLGFPSILPALLIGTLAGAVAGLWLLATRRAGRKDPMAYGPYLALGAWIVWMRSAGLWP